MKIKSIGLTVIILLFVSLSFTTVAKAVEIKYDDGTPEIAWNIAPAYKVGVMFTESDLPYSQNLLNKISIPMYSSGNSSPDQLKMFFLNNDATFSEIHAPIFTPALQVGWNDIDVHSLGIVVENDFLIGFQFLRSDGQRSGGYLGYDTDIGPVIITNHSYEYNETKWPFPYWHAQSADSGLWMIRVDVQPVPEPSTMLLLGSGLIGLAGYGRKKFFKK